MTRLLRLMSIAMPCLAACSSSGVQPDSDDYVVFDFVDFYELDAETLSRYRKIGFIPDAAAQMLGYEAVTPVAGSYCEKVDGTYIRATTPDGLREARDQLRIRAASIGADAYSMSGCKSAGSPGGNKRQECTTSITCYGTAYKLRLL